MAVAVGAALVVVSAGGAVSRGKPSWLPPAGIARGSGSQVAFDGRGDATVLLSSCCSVRVVVRPAGGRFGAPVAVSTPGEDADAARLAVNASGDAAIVWVASADGVVDASIRRAGRVFGPEEQLSSYSVFTEGQAPVIALDASGDVFAAWRFEGPAEGGGVAHSVQASVRGAGGGWGSARTVSTPGTQPAGDVRLAVDAGSGWRGGAAAGVHGDGASRRLRVVKASLSRRGRAARSASWARPVCRKFVGSAQRRGRG